VVTGLQNTIEKTVQKKKSNTSIENTNNLKLSIQFSLDGFSFCISNLENEKDELFTEYLFDTQLKTPEALLEEIKPVFKNDKNLHLDFKNVNVIYRNNLNSLVPIAYFDENNLSQYLNFSIKTLKTDYIAYDTLKNTEANNVYIPYVNINNYLFQHFGEFEYRHHLSVYIDKLIDLNNEKDSKTMYINVDHKSFDIVVLKGKELLFSNIFSYKTKEDFLYYVLFVAEQLKLDTNSFNLFISGKINEDSELFKLCYNYIRNIKFLESNNSIFNFLEAKRYSNFILLHK